MVVINIILFWGSYKKDKFWEKHIYKKNNYIYNMFIYDFVFMENLLSNYIKKGT